MRLRACIGGLLLGASACAALPEMVRIEVDGRMIELRQRGLPAPLRGDWSRSPDCGSAGDASVPADAIESVRMISDDELELIAESGLIVRLYRCG